MKKNRLKYRSELQDNFIEDILRVFINGANP